MSYKSCPICGVKEQESFYFILKEKDRTIKKLVEAAGTALAALQNPDVSGLIQTAKKELISAIAKAKAEGKE